MKRKTSNILICILAVIVVGCGVMAAGTFGGWFGDKDAKATEEVQTQVSEEQMSEEMADVTDNAQNNSQKDENAKSKDNKTTGDKNTCTISIKCSSILKHMDQLEKGKEKYVPSNGIILSTSTIEFNEGDSVYDVLKRACSAAGIPMSARSSSMGIYVEGINGLFEFDCGGMSGWMYSVNGTAPNHGSSEHIVKNGDNIVWYYTCGN